MNATLEQAGGVASLAGKVALVTGANAGIGLASAQAMALAGAYVYVTGRNPDRGANTVAGIEAAGGKASFLRLDVTIEAEWAQATAAVRDRFGRLDILFNNAGNLIYAPIEEMPLETVWYMARLNLEGGFLGMTYAWPLMKDTGGIILNMGGDGGIPEGVAFSGSKGCMAGLNRAGVIDGRRHGIRIVYIHPGSTWTQGMERVTGFTKEEYDRNNRESGRTPLGRGAESADIAAAVVYLASDDARHINAIDYYIDGGSNAG